MVIVLSILGLLAAAWVWQNVHPVAGLVVGFLFIGGAGWKALGSLIGLMRPSARQAYGVEGREFIAAWEERFGVLAPGGMNHPGPGTFQRWLKARKQSGVSAGAWIDAQLYPSVFDAMASVPTLSDDIAEVGVTAYCVVQLSPRSAQQMRYPARMVLDADDEGFTVSLREHDPSFDLEWGDVYSWDRSTSASGGNEWLLAFDADSSSVPVGVQGIRVIEVHPDEEALWEGYLKLHVSSASGSE